MFTSNELHESFRDSPTLYEFAHILHTNPEDEILIEKSLDPKIVLESDKFGFNALHYAIACDNETAVKSILKNPALTDKKKLELLKAEDINGNHTLHIAVTNVTVHSKVIPELLQSAKESAISEDPYSNPVVSERFEMNDFLHKPNLFGYDPFYIALSTNTISEFGKLFYEHGYDIRMPAFVVADDSSNPIKVFQIPPALMAFKWLESDASIYYVTEWLFRHGADIHQQISIDTLKKLGLKKISLEFGEKISSSEITATFTLSDIAKAFDHKLTLDFLLSNGAGFSSYDETVSYHAKNNKIKLHQDILSYHSHITSNSIQQRNVDLEKDSYFSQCNLEDFLVTTNCGHTVFSLSIIHGYYTFVESMLLNSPELIREDIVLKYDNRKTPLVGKPIHFAVKYGSDKRKVDFYQDKEHHQQTVLEVLLSMDSPWYKDHICTELLLEENDKGLTALNLASRYGYLHATKTITKAYFDILSSAKDLNNNAKKIVKDMRNSLIISVKFNRNEIKMYLREALRTIGARQETPNDSESCSFILDNQYSRPIQNNQATQHSEVDFDGIVFQGGGVRGISHAGAIEAFEELSDDKVNLNHVRYAGGTSVGALIAALYGTGHKSDDLKKIITEKIQLPTLLDGSEQDYSTLQKMYRNFYQNKSESIDTSDALHSLSGFYLKYQAEIHKLPTWIYHGRWYQNLYSKFKLSYGLLKLGKEFNITTSNTDITMHDVISLFDNLRIKHGLFNGDKLLAEVENHIKSTTGKDHLTYEELHFYASTSNEMKDVYIVAVDIMRKKSQIFSYAHTPNDVISDGVRSSISIPFLFKPHERYVKPPGRERALDITNNGAKYIDGGLIDNYPDWLFQGAANRSIGIRLLKPLLWDKYANKTPAMSENIENLFQFTTAVFKSLLSKQESDFENRCDPNDTILINTKNVDTLDFEASSDDKAKLLKAGKLAVKRFYGAQSKVIKDRNAKKKRSNPEQSINLAGFFNSTCHCGLFNSCPPKKDELNNASRFQ